MCTLALYFQALKDCPLLIAANRDEFLSRPSTSPEVLLEEPWVFGGRDLQSGGTWLGINSYGMFVGILNRRSAGKRERVEKRSRGLLCLDLLKTKDTVEARGVLSRERVEIYDPFNLVFANAREAFVAHNTGRELECLGLEPGMHVVGNVSIYDRSGGKTNHASGLFSTAGRLLAPGTTDRSPMNNDSTENDGITDLPSMIRILRGILSDHRLRVGSSNPREAICVHSGDYGTVSSSLLFYKNNEKQFDFYHTSGPPCLSDYEKCAL